MASSDHTSFSNIKKLYGLNDDAVQKLMRTNLKEGSYKAWRRRVRVFSDRRANYKWVNKNGLGLHFFKSARNF